jgi:hypothetical protein
VDFKVCSKKMLFTHMQKDDTDDKNKIQSFISLIKWLLVGADGHLSQQNVALLLSIDFERSLTRNYKVMRKGRDGPVIMSFL